MERPAEAGKTRPGEQTATATGQCADVNIVDCAVSELFPSLATDGCAVFSYYQRGGGEG